MAKPPSPLTRCAVFIPKLAESRRQGSCRTAPSKPRPTDTLTRANAASASPRSLLISVSPDRAAQCCLPSLCCDTLTHSQLHPKHTGTSWETKASPSPYRLRRSSVANAQRAKCQAIALTLSDCVCLRQRGCKTKGFHAIYRCEKAGAVASNSNILISWWSRVTEDLLSGASYQAAL